LDEDLLLGVGKFHFGDEGFADGLVALRVEADRDFGGFFRACEKVTLKKHQACADEKNKSGHGSANLKELSDAG
jgi:hypothetical protein